MAIVVALKLGQRNTAALALAAALARALDEPVIAAAVLVIAPGVPSPLRDGMTDEDFVALVAADVMAEASQILGDALRDQRPLRARSVRAGLLELLGEAGSDHLVLGSAAGGRPGCVNVGDTASALLHTASVPVYLAPHGYAGGADPQQPLRRITVALGPGDGSRQALYVGADLAHRIDGMLRTVSFWVRQNAVTPFGGGASYGAELSAQWHEQMEATIDREINGLSALRLPARWIDRTFGDGQDWDEAMASVEWAASDLLIVGSRPRGGIAGVFLGSKAAEILRHSPVPVAVLPG